MSAIASTLELIRDKLDEFFKNQDPQLEDWVILSNIVDPEGRVNDAARNKIVMCLAGIEHDTTVATWNRTTPAGSNQYGVVTPPININLLVFFYANFYDKNYVEGLSLIAGVVSFFQQNPWFTHASLLGLDTSIDKVAMEMTNMDPTQTNYLVGMLGAKYLPSVLYKLRMIPFRADTVSGFVPAAQGVRGGAEAPQLDEQPPAAPRPFPARNLDDPPHRGRKGR